MLVTVTNTSVNPINTPDVIAGGVGPSAVYAVGGAVLSPLPWPFAHIGPLAASATYQLPMHPRDWAHKNVPGQTFEAGEAWQTMVQAGVVSLTVAAETHRNDQEELFLNLV